MASNSEKVGADMKRSTNADSQADLRKRLSDELRSMYNNVLDEPLPDNMMNFLRDIEREEIRADDQKKRPESGK